MLPTFAKVAQSCQLLCPSAILPSGPSRSGFNARRLLRESPGSIRTSALVMASSLLLMFVPICGACTLQPRDRCRSPSSVQEVSRPFLPFDTGKAWQPRLSSRPVSYTPLCASIRFIDSQGPAGTRTFQLQLRIASLGLRAFDFESDSGRMARRTVTPKAQTCRNSQSDARADRA